MCIFFEKQPLTPVRHTPFVPSLANMLAVRCQAYGTTLPKAVICSCIATYLPISSGWAIIGITIMVSLFMAIYFPIQEDEV